MIEYAFFFFFSSYDFLFVSYLVVVMYVYTREVPLQARAKLCMHWPKKHGESGVGSNNLKRKEPTYSYKFVTIISSKGHIIFNHLTIATPCSLKQQFLESSHAPPTKDHINIKLLDTKIINF